MSDVCGLGVDVIEIERVAHAIERYGERFLGRIYTPREIAACHGKRDSLAGRFAAKEAVSKALGIGVLRLRWRDIEIQRGPLGRPVVSLEGTAADWARRHGIGEVLVTISHSKGLAVAAAVACAART